MTKSLWYCPLCFTEGTDPDVTRCPEDGAPVELVAQREKKWIDKIIDSKYRVVGLIGAGGMAEVFEVERIATQKRLALKLLKASLTADSCVNSRFRQEAMMISLIAHRNIVTLEDFGVLDSHSSYMVMELLHGYSLGEALRMGPIQPEAAFQIMLQTCEGMAAAHERGVIHRDLKPDNIFIHQATPQAAPVVKILDLGIGKLYTSPAARGLTLSGTVVGTPEYMSPEQCRGQDAGVASDIYSLGIVLYEMLFGRAPFQDESPLLVLPRQLTETPAWDDALASDLKIPSGAKEVVFKALSKDPAARQESMMDLQRDISGVLSRLRRGSSLLPDSVLLNIESVRNKAAEVNRQSRNAAQAHLDTLPNGLAEYKKRETRTATLAFAANVYWVGRRHQTQLECNPYLRVFEGNGNTISILIDPGPPRDLDVVVKNISNVIGSVDNLNYIFINHQDPDVAGNAAQLQRLNPEVMVVCSEDTWRLARHCGLDEKRFIATEKIPGQRIGLSTGHFIHFVPTPFCHARGATMMYDPDTQVLFSGDLFGGTSIRDSYVFSDADDDGIRVFHQVYMPSQRALHRALHAISRLSPAPRIIAPQHGNIIRGDHIPRVMRLLKRMRVGMDLFEFNERHPEMLTLANELMRVFATVAGKGAAKKLITKMRTDYHLVSQFEMHDPDQIVAFKVDSVHAMESLFQLAEEIAEEGEKDQLRQSFKPLRQRIARARKIG